MPDPKIPLSTPADTKLPPVPAAAPKGRPEDDPNPGAVFVRLCLGCNKHVQTADPSGKALCMVCKDSPEAQARARAASPPEKK